MKILREHSYRDREGNLLYQKIRIDTPEKEGRFRRRQPSDKGWKWSWDGLQLVPYNLDRLVNCGDDVHIPEGEHDCDTLTRLGFIATTNPESGSALWKPEYTECLDSTVRGVYIWRDQDATGSKHSDDVAQSIYGHVPFIKIVDVPRGNDVSEFLDDGMSPKEQAAEVMKLCIQAEEWKPTAKNSRHDEPSFQKSESAIPNLDDVLNDDSFIEWAPVFLETEDPPQEYIIPEIIPAGKLVTFAGDPRSMKTLGADEIAVAVVSCTPAFGLERFSPSRKYKTWRIAQEDPRRDEKMRIKALLASRGIKEFPKNLAFSIHKGIDLDKDTWKNRIINAIKKHGFELVIIDPIRRFSGKVDKGPAEVRELTGYLRQVVIETGATIIIIHHFVKPSQNKSDERRRAHRTSGGDWFASVECPIFFEKIADDKTLVVPEDFKFSADPAGFTFQFLINGDGGITLQGKVEKEKDTASIVADSKITSYLSEHPRTCQSKIRSALRMNRDFCYERLDVLRCKSILSFEKEGTKKLWSVCPTA